MKTRSFNLSQDQLDDFVKSTDEWADGPADIADIYRSVARRIRSVIGDTHAKGQGAKE